MDGTCWKAWEAPDEIKNSVTVGFIQDEIFGTHTFKIRVDLPVECRAMDTST